MTKRDAKGKPKKPAKRPSDVNQFAQQLVRESTEKESVNPTDAEISRVMSALGRRGGKIGGRRRAAVMTPERRREVALKAARSRWDRK